jgi:hypothetical protein
MYLNIYTHACVVVFENYYTYMVFQVCWGLAYNFKITLMELIGGNI